MANANLLQVRTQGNDKIEAAEILEKLGTNLSTVINMLLKQIILTEGIPFEVTLKHENLYSESKAIDEISATMRFENMELSDCDIDLLKQYKRNELSAEQAREVIMKELGISHE